MKSIALLLLLNAWLGFVLPAGAAEFTAAEFNRATEPLKSYAYGQDKVDLSRIETWVASASQDPQQRPVVEQRLLDLLATATTRDARQFLCRQLRTVGTARSVSSLERLLSDPELSHLARFALGRIEAPEAGEALRRALPKTSGDLQAGIIDTLGQRKEMKAQTEISALVDSPDANVAGAAIRALGKFGDAESVTRLLQAQGRVTPALRLEAEDALLRCAETLLAAGKGPEAAKIYEVFYPKGASQTLQVAGLRGLAAARPAEANALLLGAIQTGDPDLRPHAIALLAAIPGPTTTATLISLAGSMPPEAQERVIRALADRGDTSAAPAAIALLNSPNARVRMAACEALAEIGGAAAIPTLAKTAGQSTGPEQQIARASLVRLGGGPVNEAFMTALSTGDPKSRAEIARAIGQRGLHEGLGDLLRAARGDRETAVRREAIVALGRVALTTDLPLLIELLLRPQEAGDRDEIVEAITQVFNRTPDRNLQAQTLIAALGQAPVEAKPALLGLLNQPATDEALQAVRQAVADPQALVSEAASRALGEWPNAAPAEDLYRIASTNPSPTARTLALRGYVRLAALADDPTAMYVKAMALARSDDERKLVLGGLGNADTLVALELAEQERARPGLEAEASLALVRVAAQYTWIDPVRGTAALTAVASETKQDYIKQEAQSALKRFAELKNYVVAWKGVGPYQVEGVHDGRAVFGNPFPPEENPADPALRWRKVKAVFEGDKRINLEATFGQLDYCCAYLRTTVWSSSAQEVRLAWAVDDYIRGWLNGKPIQEGNITLREGANTLMLKVGDHGGEWNFNCRLLKPDGSPAAGLRFEAK